MITILAILFLFGLGTWLGFGIIALKIACGRGGRVFQWAVFGILLGPVALFLVLRVMAHRCPSCNVSILRAIHICISCVEPIPRLKNNPVGPFWTYRRDW